MEKFAYVMLIEKGKTFDQIDEAMIIEHVDRIRELDDEGRLVLCGPVDGYPGISGMIVFRAESYEEAEAICRLEPFFIKGYATYKLFSLRVSNRENNYLL
ncbi:MAG: YciI family protein [Methanomassiliicoccaceae archaeon]|nr:YciI family protein [Methanomassiliicoccaceae archaeon]